MSTPAACARKPCRLPASMYGAGGMGDRIHGLCTWHHQQREAQTPPDFADFSQWVDQLRARKICAVWTHYSPSLLWDLLQGTPASDFSPRACQRGSCPFAGSKPETVGTPNRSELEPEEAPF